MAVKNATRMIFLLAPRMDFSRTSSTSGIEFGGETFFSVSKTESRCIDLITEAV